MDALKFFQFTATVAVGVLAGSVIYMYAVEHPARMTLDDTLSLHRQWREGLRRLGVINGGITLVALVSGIAAFAVDRTEGRPWLISAGMLVFNLAYTAIVMYPRVIEPISDYEIVANMRPGEVRVILEEHNRLHGVRAISDFSNLLWCVYNLVYN